MRSHYLAVAAPLLALAVAQDTSHSSHESHAHDEASHQSHEGERFEAAAVYDVEAGSGSFAVIPAAGSFEEETFAFMIVPCASADLGGLEEAEEEAEAGKIEDLAFLSCRISNNDAATRAECMHTQRMLLL